MFDPDFTVRLLRAMAEADARDSLYWDELAGRGFVFSILCPGVFDSGLEAELILPEAIDELEAAIADVKAATDGDATYGPRLYCARRRGKRPIGAAYPSDTRLYPLFDACGDDVFEIVVPVGPGRHRVPELDEVDTATLAQQAVVAATSDPVYPPAELACPPADSDASAVVCEPQADTSTPACDTAVSGVAGADSGASVDSGSATF